MKFQIEVIKSKIHRVTVTQADLNYVGSITIDEALLEAANIVEGEKVQIMDINNGERFETYTIKGERNSGCIRRTQGAGGRRGHHRLLRPDGLRAGQAVPPLDHLPRHGDEPAGQVTPGHNNKPPGQAAPGHGPAAAPAAPAAPDPKSRPRNHGEAVEIPIFNRKSPFPGRFSVFNRYICDWRFRRRSPATPPTAAGTPPPARSPELKRHKMDITLSVAAFLFSIIGTAGCIIPVLPGTVMSYAGLLCAYFTSYSHISTPAVWIWLAVSVAVCAADYFLPAWMTRRFGGSKAGAIGATVGVIAGFFLFPPFGVILGPFMGAVLGELLHDKSDPAKALLIGFGSFLSFIVGTGLKLAASVGMFIHVASDTYPVVRDWFATIF